MGGLRSGLIETSNARKSKHRKMGIIMLISEIKGINTTEELLALLCPVRGCAPTDESKAEAEALVRKHEAEVRTTKWDKWLDTKVNECRADHAFPTFMSGFQGFQYLDSFMLDGKSKSISGCVSGFDCLDYAIEHSKHSFTIREVYVWRKAKDAEEKAKKEAVKAA